MTLTLRPFSATDLQPVYDIEYGKLADRTWLAFNGPYFNDPVPTWYEFKAKNSRLLQQQHHRLIWLNDEIVGEVSAHWVDGDLQQWLEIGIIIYLKNDWGKGIATMAIQQWLAELFAQHSNLPHIGLTTWSGNKGMIHASQKAGLSLEGTIRQVRFWQGEYYDSVKYGILRSEFIKLATGQKNHHNL